MKKLLFLFVTALLIVPSIVLAQNDSLTRDQINNISKSVVLVLALDSSGQPYASGSGTIIQPNGLIYTNRHVLEGASDWAILTPTNIGEQAQLAYYASPAFIHNDVDFAELQIDRDAQGNPIQKSSLHLPVIPLADSPPDIGDRIFVFGYPALGDAHLVVTNGTVTTIENETLNNQRIPYWYQTDAQISPGNSGGLAVNLMGQMIGIPTKVQAEGETLGRLGGILSDAAIQGALQSPNDTLQLPINGPVPIKFSADETQPSTPAPNNNQQQQQPNNQQNPQTNQQLSIEITNVEPDFTYQNTLGIKVHTKIEAVGYNTDTLRAAVFAFWDDGSPIQANNRASSDARSDTGQLTVQQTLTATYDDTVWDDAWFFIPYDDFPDGRTGTYPAYFEAQIGIDGQQFTAYSDDSAFQYTYPNQQLIVDIANLEHNIQYNGEDGMKIHSHINTLGYQGQQVRVAAFFYWADGTPIKGDNAPANDRSTDGQLTVQAVITPSYDNSQWNDYWFFIPYSYFPTGLHGDQSAYVEVEIGLDSGGFTSWSQDEDFVLNYDK